MANSEELEYRLSELAARLARVERRVGIFPPDAAAPGPEVAPPVLEAPVSPTEAVVTATPALSKPVELLPPTPTHPPVAPPTSPPHLPPPIPPRTSAPFRPRTIPSGLFNRTPEPKKVRTDAFSMESLIGGRWFMVAGALVVVVAVGLALQLAYAQGWFGLMTPQIKCLTVAGFGAVLLGLGEVARRKINAAASAGLSAAGIAALYASAYAAYGPYDLIGPTLGFVLLAVVSGLGIAVAVRAGLLSVAALSIIASYVTPVLLSDAPSKPMVLPAYLLAILGVGLWLSAWRRVPFRPLRALVWWGTMIYGGLWTLRGDAPAHPILGLTFLGLVWCAVHAELTFSARRGAIGRIPAPASGRIIYQIIRPLLTSFSSSAWAAGLGVMLIKSGTIALPTWFPPAGGTVAAAILAGVLAGNVRVLRERPRDDAERLGAALALQAGALLIAAVALGLADWMEVVAWLAMGVAAIGVGRWIGGRALHVYGLVVLAIGAGRLLVYDSWAWGLGGSGVTVLWLHLTRWSLLMALAGTAWLVAGGLIRWPRGVELEEDLAEAELAASRSEAKAWWPTGHTCIAIGLALFGIASLHQDSLATPIAVLVAGLGLVGAYLGRRLRSEGLLAYGIVLIAGATAWLALADWRVLGETDTTVRLAGLVLTRWSAGMAIAAVAWFGAWRIARTRATEVGGQWVAAAPVLLGVAITTLFACLLHPEGSTASESVVGIALGLVVVALARLSKSPMMAVYSLIVLGVVTVWLVLFEWATEGTRASAHVAGGLVLTRWTGLMLLIAAAWMVAGRVVGSRLGRAAAMARMVATGLGLALVLASVLDSHAEAAWVCGAWLGLSVLVLASNRLDQRAGLDRFGLGALALTVAAWVAAFPAHGWFLWHSPAGLHPGLWMALAIVGVAGAAWRLRGLLRAKFEPAEVILPVLAAATIALMFAATSLEVARVAGDWASDERARKAAVSIWWGLFAIAMVVGGFWKRCPACRYVGLALLAAATAKALIYDLADITPAWRVASLLGLGLLMMGVAIGYSRAAQRLASGRKAGESEPEESANGRDKSGVPSEP